MKSGRTPVNGAENGRLEVVDRLRGVAVLCVCFSHFMSANNGISKESWWWKIGTHGWLGVEIFFVISGFIIPLALNRAGFALVDYPRFLLRRVMRLDPPYLIAVVAAVVMGVLASSITTYQGEPFRFNLPQLLLHFAFLNTFFGYDWVKPAFWSLAIEFQYYLLIGLLYPWLSHRSMTRRVGVMMVLAFLALAFPGQEFVFHWLFLFLMGVVAFHWHIGFLTPLALSGALIAATIGIVFTHGWTIAIVSLATALMIMFGRLPGRGLVFFGTISYSLYLLHGPIGVKVVNACGRHVSSTEGGVVAIFLGLFISTICAVVLYHLVERPAQRWASAVHYQKPVALSVT